MKPYTNRAVLSDDEADAGSDEDGIVLSPDSDSDSD
jgi:hypothetical protein